MKSVSLNGKNWVSKEFNSDDVTFFKTNYFLDEIVAKLLCIRPTIDCRLHYLFKRNVYM